MRVKSVVCPSASGPSGDEPPARGRGDPRAAARPATQVRLTRRGRVVLAGLLILVAVGVGLLASSAGGAQPGTRTVSVRPGDTLWSLAGRYAPSRDPVGTIELIRDLNHLDGYVIYPGEELILPASGSTP
jgi:LysM repeat protein